MRLALITNARSGGELHPGTLARGLRERGAEVETFAIEARERASGGGFDRIAVAGGDGSIGCAAELAGRLAVPLAVIPGGTANDFARAHELPGDVEAALDLAVSGERVARLDLGRLGDRAFVNVASAGLAPEAARRASAHKSRLGPLAYALGALQAGLTSEPVQCAVRVDGEPAYEGEAWQLIASISGAFGGGSKVADADPQDGRLHITVVPAGSRLGLVWRAAGMRLGSIADQPGVVAAEGREVDLGLPPEAAVNVDGELCAPGPLTVEPGAFSLVAG